MREMSRDKLKQMIAAGIDVPESIDLEVELEQEQFFSLDREQSLVLLLGQISHEGVTSALCAAGRQYKQKYPESSVENWRSILRYFRDFKVREVLWKLNPATYGILVDPEYKWVADRLLLEIASRPHILFVHQDLLSGEIDDEIVHDKFQGKKNDIVNAVNALFEKHKLNVLPYSRNAEVTALSLEFIAHTEQGLLLRVYVPSGRMWSHETDRLLQLFRDYLSRVSKLTIRLDQKRTDRGIIYEFHGDAETNCDLSAEFDQFSQFVDLCVTDPDRATEILRSKDIAIRDVSDILTRYAKEARRLHVDLKHDRERKILGIRQRMESELVDVLPDAAIAGAIDALVNSIVPQVRGSRTAMSVDQNPFTITGATNLTLNLQPTIVHAVNSIVAHEVCGNVNLTHHDQELLSLIQEYAPTEAIQLASAVHELGDPSAPKSGRLLAKQKLMKFLIGVGSRVGDVATGVLQKYIEKQMGL